MDKKTSQMPMGGIAVTREYKVRNKSQSFELFRLKTKLYIFSPNIKKYDKECSFGMRIVAPLWRMKFPILK